MRSVILVLAATIFLASCSTDNPTQTTAIDDNNPVPAHFQNERDAQPLTPTLAPSFFQDPRLVRVYEIAQRIPAVLAQQPCYCYCDRGHGHKSLLDCQRDTHSAGCTVCRKEVLLADRLTRMGLSAAEIRKAIIRGDWKAVQE